MSVFGTQKARRKMFVAAWRSFEERHGMEALHKALQRCGGAYDSPDDVPNAKIAAVLMAFSMSATAIDYSLPRRGNRSRLRPWRELARGRR
jgi:hypothetical protein